MKRGMILVAIFMLSSGYVMGDYTQKPYDSRPAPTEWGNSQSTDKSVWNYDATPPASPDQIGNNADLRITRVVMSELVRDNTLSPGGRSAIVTTSKGIVTIRGTVLTLEEKSKIEEMVRRVYGVQGVHNQLNVPKPPAPKRVNVQPLTPEEQKRIDEYDQQQELDTSVPSVPPAPGAVQGMGPSVVVPAPR